MKKLRIFIAIDLPVKTRDYLFQTGKKMAKDLPNRAVRWVAPENIHLTLRFLGDTAEDKLPAISTELDRIAANFKPFTLALDRLGCFPNRKRPRVIWAGLAGDTKRLSRLQSQIESAVQSLGWEGENRPFRSHVTIGRIKDKSQAKFLRWDLELERQAIPVEAVNLIESRLHPSGPEYVVRHHSNL